MQSESKNTNKKLRSDKTANKSSKDKSTNLTKKLALTFLALTLFIFAVYFALTFKNMRDSDSLKKISKLDSILYTKNNVSDDEPEELTEIQEILVEKINQQPDLKKILHSIQQITFKSEISNKKIIQKIQTEMTDFFQTTTNGIIRMEVDIFDDGSLTEKQKGIDEGSEPDSDKHSEWSIVLQISLFDIKSKNKVSEFGVTLPMKYFITE